MSLPSEKRMKGFVGELLTYKWVVLPTGGASGELHAYKAPEPYVNYKGQNFPQKGLDKVNVELWSFTFDSKSSTVKFGLLKDYLWEHP